MNTSKQNIRTRAVSTQFQGGQAIIIAVMFFLSGSLVIISGVTVPVLNEIETIKVLQDSKRSFYYSESGVEDASYRIKFALPIDSTEELIFDNGSATVSITDTGSQKEIFSKGSKYDHIRTSFASLTKTSGTDFFYGAQAGDGGIEMEENSDIEGVGGSAGNVYSNGAIIGGQGATITGDAIVASGLLEDMLAQSLVCNQDQIVGQAKPQIDFAQSFIPSDSQPLAKISLYIKKVGNPGDKDIRIVADDNGAPDIVELAKDKIKSSLVGTIYDWIDVSFSSPANLVQGQTYWIVFDAKKDANKYWIWCKDNNEGYTDGRGVYSEDWDDDTWIPIVGDLTFKTFLGVGTTFIDNVNITGFAKANTIIDSNIGGDAYYQTITSSTVGGTSYPGSPNPPVVTMPISDANITDWKNNAGCGVQPAVSPCLHTGDYEITIDKTLGPLTITGDLLMDNNNITLTVDGVIFVQGNLDIKNGSTIKCAASLGTDSCLIITDGWIHIKNNGTFQGSGTSGSYIMLLSTLACTGSSGTNCTHHTGSMDIHNNASGAIFYAANGQVNLHNGVTVTEAVGYKIRLDHNAKIIYEQGLINTSFSSGSSGSWGFTDWRETE